MSGLMDPSEATWTGTCCRPPRCAVELWVAVAVDGVFMSGRWDLFHPRVPVNIVERSEMREPPSMTPTHVSIEDGTGKAGQGLWGRGPS